MGHSCGILLYVTLVGHSCGTVLLDTLAKHSRRTHLWDTHARHSCLSLLWDALVGYSCRTHSSDTLAGHLWDSLVETSSKSHASSLQNERVARDFQRGGKQRSTDIDGCEVVLEGPWCEICCPNGLALLAFCYFAGSLALLLLLEETLHGLDMSENYVLYGVFGVADRSVRNPCVRQRFRGKAYG